MERTSERKLPCARTETTTQPTQPGGGTAEEAARLAELACERVGRDRVPGHTHSPGKRRKQEGVRGIEGGRRVGRPRTALAGWGWRKLGFSHLRGQECNTRVGDKGIRLANAS